MTEFSTLINKVILGDALQLMKQIPSESVDMTFADPPFNLKKKYGKY
jgi:site-specific DNA-methyltransferase (adenine-specific)